MPPLTTKTLTLDRRLRRRGEGRRQERGGPPWPSGTKYVGQWKDDKCNGKGTKTWKSGDKYVGQFEDDKFHDQGTKTYATATSTSAAQGSTRARMPGQVERKRG